MITILVPYNWANICRNRIIQPAKTTFLSSIINSYNMLKKKGINVNFILGKAYLKINFYMCGI